MFSIVIPLQQSDENFKCPHSFTKGFIVHWLVELGGVVVTVGVCSVDQGGGPVDWMWDQLWMFGSFSSDSKSKYS